MDFIATTDLIVIAGYLIVILLVGFYFVPRKEESSADFFLAGRSMGWFAVGASLFVTNISSEHFVGLAGSGAAFGLAVGSFEWMAVFWLIMLGWLFAPLYLKSGIYTVPDFLGKRFGPTVKLYLTSISIVAYILTKISVTLYAGGLLLRYVLGIDIYTSALIIVLLTGLYTIVGGLRSVMYTSVVQLFFLLGGTALVTWIGLEKVGGFTGLRATLPSDFFSMFKPISDPHFPWTGILLGAPILGIWYWCTDQYIVQRVLAARNLQQARQGTIFAGFLKLTPVFLLVLPGLIAVAIYPGVKGDEAFPILIGNGWLPTGVQGLFIAGLLSAQMSSLASFFHSTATLFTMDFYRHFNPGASQRKLVLIGRLATTVIVVTAVLWVPLTKLISTNLYIYLQSVQAYISPPIAALFLIGVFWKKINGTGALWSLVVGGLLGALRLVLEMISKVGIRFSGIPAWLVNINFLHFAILLFVISSVVMVGVSLLVHQKHREPVTFDYSPRAVLETISLAPGNRLNLLFSGALIVLVVGFWTLFI